MSRNLSSKEKKTENVARLRKWISETNISHVPVNQFGDVARKTICEQLSIPRSTVGKGELSDLFKTLDEKLKDRRKKLAEEGIPKKKRKSLTVELQEQCRTMRAALAAQAANLALLEYLEDRGISLRTRPLSATSPDTNG
ncbi:hypothetical protein Q8F57_033175 [Paraburkholderia terrae]|uniref:hypothetical protein n=1 Tax=Paraburkholderia terrae TaxID=311230 RepID=UPI00296AED11|nr:hypothetical protein [Paraburkholderia terrae]MDW3657807.1 hypothetical protein [Paraburkholderia terrae]